MHSRNQFFGIASCAFGLALLLNVFAGVGCAGEIKRINVSCTLAPSEQLAAEVRVIEVDKPNYPHRATEDGVYRDLEQACYNQLIRQLQARFREAAPEVAIREREDNKTLDVAERERAALGDPDEPAPRMIADAVIVPRFVVAVDWDSYIQPPSLRERAISTGGRLIPVVGGLVPAAESKPVQRLSVRVTCDMHMSLTRSKQMRYAYGRTLEAVEQTDPGKLYGLDVHRTPLQMSSVERLAERLAQEHVDNFLSQFLKIERVVRLDLTSVSDAAAAAIDLLNMRHVAEARSAARAAYEHKPKKEHAACFIVGLTYEMEQDWAQALEWYGRALGIKPLEPEYENAFRRADGMDRAVRLAARRSGAAD